MAVVINEFEATAEPASAHESSSVASTSSSKIDPASLRQALRQQARRIARLRAH